MQFARIKSSVAGLNQEGGGGMAHANNSSSSGKEHRTGSRGGKKRGQAHSRSWMEITLLRLITYNIIAREGTKNLILVLT